MHKIYIDLSTATAIALLGVGMAFGGLLTAVIFLLGSRKRLLRREKEIWDSKRPKADKQNQKDDD